MSGPFNPNDLNSRPRVDDRIWIGAFWGAVFSAGLIALGWFVLSATGVL